MTLWAFGFVAALGATMFGGRLDRWKESKWNK